MKIRLQWKDPDRLPQDVLAEQMGLPHSGWTPEQYVQIDIIEDELHAAGLGEYIQVEYDTETKEAKILHKRKK